MGIHREGTPTLLLGTTVVCLALFALLKWPFLPCWATTIIAVLLLTVLGILFWFFRVPRRSVTPDDTAILSPCDGKVVVIEEVHEPEYFNDRRLQVSIFMSPLNVHINYHPISGVTSYCKYHPGEYLVAWHPKSSTHNERSTVVTRHPVHGEVLFRQIAGALARRICTYSKEGAAAQQGSEFGFIKFGSRVDLFLPLSVRTEVTIGQRVQGATTVIARFA
jgi:phosphatidylserine decarboxylase